MPDRAAGLRGNDAWTGVWVNVELERGRVHPVSWELLGEGRKLAAQLGVDIAPLPRDLAPGSTPSSCDYAPRARGVPSCILPMFAHQPFDFIGDRTQHSKSFVRPSSVIGRKR